MSIGQQIVWLFVLALPVASISWTITHEEVFRELREYFIRKYRRSRNIFSRKFYYLFTCEYCFSHYVAIFMLILTNYTLLYEDWRGYVIGGFAMVWVANIYMSIFLRLRLDIKKEKVDIESEEKKNNGG